MNNIVSDADVAVPGTFNAIKLRGFRAKTPRRKVICLFFLGVFARN
jgi:hypothetical protein